MENLLYSCIQLVYEHETAHNSLKTYNVLKT